MEETLGKHIALHRKRLSLTQDALAEQLGVTAQAVSKWENDQSCPDILMLPKLAAIFSCTTDELLGIAPKESQSTAETAPQPSVEHQEAKSASLRWKALTSPGAAFGFWLFLTGLVALIDAVRLPPYDLADIGLVHIAISCGIFVFGIFSLFRRFSPLRLGCTMAGGVFIFTLVTEPGIADMDWYVPLLAGVALFGLDLLIDTIRKPKGAWKAMPNGHIPAEAAKNYCTYDSNRFSCVTCFGESDRLIQLPLLCGGKGEVTFGDLTIDLSGCSEIADGCSIDVNCNFGSLEILVPRKYRVEAAASTAFGAVDTKGVPDPDAAVTIFLNCNVRFGEITIRHI